MEELIEKLELEASELYTKLSKLRSALGTQGFEEKVGAVQYYLLVNQHGAMDSYYNILQARIKNLRESIL